MPWIALLQPASLDGALTLVAGCFLDFSFIFLRPEVDRI